MSKKYTCRSCGADFEDETTVGTCGLCFECQKKRFNFLARQNGAHIALFLMCGMVDIPCLPTLIPKGYFEGKGNKWEAYIDLLANEDKLTHDGREAEFRHGVTNLRLVFGRELTETDFAKYVAMEQAREKENADKYPGTPEQRERWGTGDLWRGVPMTAALYDELDKQYSDRAASYRGVTITPQMENTLVRVSKLNVCIDLLMSKGDSKTISDLQKIVDTLLAAEQMRKKDEKPVEGMKIDATVDALEKAGLMEQNAFLPIPELMKNLFHGFFKKKKYNGSVDVMDQMIADIYNTFRKNAGLEVETALPAELKAKDDLGEFEPRETEEEKENKRFLNLTPVQYEGE